MSVVTAEDPLHRSSSSSGGSRGSWLSEVVLPTVIVGVILIISLFAVIVLLMIRRHFGSPGRHDVDGPYVVHHTPMDAGAQVESLRIYHSHSGGPTVKANFGSMKTMFSINTQSMPDCVLVSL